MMPSWFYDGPDCAVASEVYIAYQDAARGLEDEGAAMDAAANAVQSFVCEPPSAVPGGDKTICIDFFIMSETFFLIAEGDNRGFDPSAPYTASRAQLYINPWTGESHLLLNGSRIDFVPGDDGPIPIPFQNGYEREPYRHLPKDVRIRKDPVSGQIDVEVEIYNGFCTKLGRAICPSIDASFTLTRQADGLTYEATTNRRDKYPSVEINQWVDGAWTPRLRDAEHPGRFGPFFLINLRRKADILRQTGDMPDGCLIQ